MGLYVNGFRIVCHQSWLKIKMREVESSINIKELNKLLKTSPQRKYQNIHIIPYLCQKIQKEASLHLISSV